MNLTDFRKMLTGMEKDAEVLIEVDGKRYPATHIIARTHVAIIIKTDEYEEATDDND